MKRTQKKPARDTYAYLRDKFIENGAGHEFNESDRKELVGWFERIDSDMPRATTPTDGIFLAEMLLNLEAEGDVVECGCYVGGSTAKLSLVAGLIGRKLFVFDSFEGLPETDPYYLRDQHCRRSDEWTSDWTAGRYAAGFETVRRHVQKYGNISVCEFVPGWFSDTLTDENIPHPVAFVFADVDLADSAQQCFTALWPRMPSGGVYATHDAAYIKVLQAIYDPDWWQGQNEHPPILFGAGYGLCDASPHLGYMVRGSDLPPEYLKRLTVDK